MLASANELITAPKSEDAKRQDLAKAYGLVDGAKQIDPGNPAIASTLATLENEYINTISLLMATQQRDLVSAYFKDTAGMNWPTDRILKAQLAWQSAPTTTVSIPSADKPKPKRVMSGGF